MSQHFSNYESKVKWEKKKCRYQCNCGCWQSKSPTSLGWGLALAVSIQLEQQCVGSIVAVTIREMLAGPECDHHVVAIMEVAKAISIRVRRGRNGRLRETLSSSELFEVICQHRFTSVKCDHSQNIQRKWNTLKHASHLNMKRWCLHNTENWKILSPALI